MGEYVTGDDRAFRRLHALVDEPIRTAVRRYVRERCEIDDIVQRT